MEYVLANLEGSNFKTLITRQPQPWWGLLSHYIKVKLFLNWPLHSLLLATASDIMLLNSLEWKLF